MDFWVVITVFEGKFDDATPFKTEKEANEFAEKVRNDYIDETIEVVPKRIEI